MQPNTFDGFGVVSFAIISGMFLMNLCKDGGDRRLRARFRRPDVPRRGTPQKAALPFPESAPLPELARLRSDSSTALNTVQDPGSAALFIAGAYDEVFVDVCGFGVSSSLESPLGLTLFAGVERPLKKRVRDSPAPWNIQALGREPLLLQLEHAPGIPAGLVTAGALRPVVSGATSGQTGNNQSRADQTAFIEPNRSREGSRSFSRRDVSQGDACKNGETH
jgi:hypothetical protein